MAYPSLNDARRLANLIACGMIISAFVLSIIAITRTCVDEDDTSSSSSGMVAAVHHFATLPEGMQHPTVPNCYMLDYAENGNVTGMLFVFSSKLSANESLHQASQCWGAIADGAKWKSPEPYIVDPTNMNGMSSSFVYSAFETSKATWQTCASDDIFGPRDPDGVVDGIDMSSPDGKNEAMFGSITDEGVIAFTVTWGVFSGAVEDRVILEADQIFNTVDYDFGDASTNSNKMDLLSIVTHEDGHYIGSIDIYSAGCEDVTMYGYSSEGETHKRTLASADITFVQSLYGDSGLCTGGAMGTPSPAATGSMLTPGMITIVVISLILLSLPGL